jgi:hypothetical protein
MTWQQVEAHVQRGDLIGFATSSPGTFILKIYEGYPDEAFLQNSQFKLRLGLQCQDGTVCFRDLYDLTNWTSSLPKSQAISLADGAYHVTLCSELPKSGLLGDGQVIHVYLKSLEAYPNLAYRGMPTLC